LTGCTVLSGSFLTEFDLKLLVVTSRHLILVSASLGSPSEEDASGRVKCLVGHYVPLP
jgi:hypothetical protein